MKQYDLSPPLAADSLPSPPGTPALWVAGLALGGLLMLTSGLIELHLHQPLMLVAAVALSWALGWLSRHLMGRQLAMRGLRRAEHRVLQDLGALQSSVSQLDARLATSMERAESAVLSVASRMEQCHQASTAMRQLDRRVLDVADALERQARLHPGPLAEAALVQAREARAVAHAWRQQLDTQASALFDAMQHMQFQDMCRQQLGHVRQSLQALSGHVQALGRTEARTQAHPASISALLQRWADPVARD